MTLVITISGPPGVGKTYLAERIIYQMGPEVLAKAYSTIDPVNDFLTKNLNWTGEKSPEYRDLASALKQYLDRFQPSNGPTARTAMQIIQDAPEAAIVQVREPEGILFLKRLLTCYHEKEGGTCSFFSIFLYPSKEAKIAEFQNQSDGFGVAEFNQARLKHKTWIFWDGRGNFYEMQLKALVRILKELLETC